MAPRRESLRRWSEVHLLYVSDVGGFVTLAIWRCHGMYSRSGDAVEQGVEMSMAMSAIGPATSDQTARLAASRRISSLRE